MPNYEHPQPSDEPLKLFLVDDNLGDIRLTQEVLNEIDTETKLQTATTGEDAIDSLTREANNESPTLPDLALIDLHLPGIDGCEVLKLIRSDSDFDRLPVILLTSSTNKEDIQRCYASSANAYLTKPPSLDEFRSLIKAIEQFWLNQVQLPPLT